MNSKGWVKLWRKTQDSDMYQSLNSKQRDVMMNILMLANHKPHKFEWGSEIIEIGPGQCVTSLSSLKKKCASDVSTQNIRTALEKLKKWDFITNKSTNKGRLITVLNWEKYQRNGKETNKEDNKEVTKEQQRGNKALTTNKNVKNVENEKNEKEVTTKDKSDSKSDDPSEKYNEYAPTTSRGLDYEQIKELWNDRVPEDLQIRAITNKRKRHLRARYKEPDFALGEIITAIQEQPFLLGDNDRGWTADFTWIIENQDHYTNILEGKYKDNKQSETDYLQNLVNDIESEEGDLIEGGVQ